MNKTINMTMPQGVYDLLLAAIGSQIDQLRQKADSVTAMPSPIPALQARHEALAEQMEAEAETLEQLLQQM